MDVRINAAHDAAFARADTHPFPDHECDSAEHSLFLKVDFAAQSGPDTTDQGTLRSGVLLFGPIESMRLLRPFTFSTFHGNPFSSSEARFAIAC